MKKLSLVCGISLLAVSIQAAPVIDGVLDVAEYGSALAVQQVETQFGDNFSELNAAYATVQGGTLYVMLTGNLESNFNKLNIFIDSQAGGQNVISSAVNPTNDGWANAHNGMQFDAGFEADYMIILRNGASQFDFDFAVVGGAASDFDTASNVFGGTLEGNGIVAGTFGTFGVGFNNSNVAGVLGGTAAANQGAALAVTTGIELAIPLSSIGNPAIPNNILVSAMVNGSNHDFLSNQFLGGLNPPVGNLGGDGAGNFIGNLSGINLNNFGGNQFFAVPEPSALALLGLGLLGVARARRRR